MAETSERGETSRPEKAPMTKEAREAQNPPPGCARHGVGHYKRERDALGQKQRGKKKLEE